MVSQPITSPHDHSQLQTRDVMSWVILATLPGLLALSHFFGWGSIVNVILASVTAVACEAAVLKLRRRPLAPYLRDNSALVTAVLLGVALPPYCPWWIVVLGVAIAIVLAKHLYGGLGYNPFNPAMVGYVVLLISFPLEMTHWATPRDLLPEGQSVVGPLSALAKIWSGIPFGEGFDGISGATPLDAYKHHGAETVQNFFQNQPLFSQARWAAVGWEWVNIGFLAGGLFLLYKKVFTWHAPVSMLVTLFLMAAIFYDGGSSASGGSPIFHLLSGGTMLGAFFIVTDPVTSASSRLGRMIYGAGVGLLVYVIRVWGNYPDAVAFGVLLMNFAAPFIDYYTVPRTYGHNKRERGFTLK